MPTRPRSSKSPGPGRARGNGATPRSGRSTTPRKGTGSSRSGQPTRSSRTTRSTTRVSPAVAAAQVSSSRAKMTGRAAILLLVVAVLAVSYASSVRAYLKQRSDINELNAEIADKRADVAALEEQKARLHDPAYIAQQARDRFGWVLPGEVSYRVIGTDGEVLSDGGSTLSDPVQPESPPAPEWWQDVYGTVQAAGQEPSSSQDSDSRDTSDGTGQKTDR